MSEEKKDHAREQAKAQLESIREMIAKLNKGTAADLYASSLSKEKCIELLTEVDIDTQEDESIEDLREAVARNIEDETIEPDDFEFDEDEARTEIHDDPISIEVRSGWASVGDSLEPEEYKITLCTGGPSARIIGELNEYREPSSARLEYQDWFTSWTELVTVGEDHDAILTYARCFYFGS